MKITVNDNPCEIRPIWANVIQNNPCECTVTVKCHANKSFSDYEKEKLWVNNFDGGLQKQA